ncbi:PadR family transcriptional regulator [Candidatus Saccharibacteria bacterium]|nr:PadR family transcriptional regulator [Candidatus Saccharibacteria bacterium]
MHKCGYCSHHRHGYMGGWQGWYRAKRGDIGSIILSLLQDKPMHGYEIISKLEEKSHGMWRPSAGSVYPTLQLLEEQDLVTSEEKNGKKVYSLTNKGKKTAEESKTEAPWEEKSAPARHFMELKEVIFEIMATLRQIAWQDNAEDKVKRVKEILGDTKSKLADLLNEVDKPKSS